MNYYEEEYYRGEPGWSGNPDKNEDISRRVIHNAICYFMSRIREYDASYHFNFSSTNNLISDCEVKSSDGRTILKLSFTESESAPIYYLHSVVLDKNLTWDNDVKGSFFFIHYYKETVEKLWEEFIKPTLDKSREAKERIEQEKYEKEYERKMKLLNPDAWATAAGVVSWILCKLILRV